MHATYVKRDTKAWRLQVWVSFAIASSLTAVGLANLPGGNLDRAFMILGYVFCLFAVFGLSKYIRDRESGQADTPMWGAVIWGGFAAAISLTGWGLWRMDIQPVWQAYLLVCWAYLVSSVFTLAKTLRDHHEANLMEAAGLANGSSIQRDKAPVHADRNGL
jgi:hypothetical protein